MSSNFFINGFSTLYFFMALWLVYMITKTYIKFELRAITGTLIEN